MPAVVETPDGDVIGIRQIMILSLSYDHRVIDGALAGRFLNRIKEILENYTPDPALNIIPGLQSSNSLIRRKIDAEIMIVS